MRDSIFSGDYSISYQAAAGANKVIKASAGKLKAIIVGKAVNSGVIEVSDHASDGDGNVKIYLEGNTLGPAVYEIDAVFSIGICVDQTTQTNVAYIYE